MPIAGRGRRLVDRAARAAQQIRARVALSRGGLAWLFGATVALVVCLALLAGVGEDVVHRNGEYRSDPTRLAWFTAHRNMLDVDAAKLLAIAGSVGVLLALAVLTTLMLIRRRVPLALAVTPLVALAGAGGVAGVAKLVVGRARPAAPLQLAAESGGSFPSGHTTDTTAFILALALVVAIVVLRRPLARAVAVVAAGLVASVMGVSRLVLGVHWPTDVLAGVALGAAVALGTVVVAVTLTRLTPPATARRTRVVARVAGWTRPSAAA
jgi:undecaprenyl-diphosphatase